MKVIGFNYNKIGIERKKPLKGKIDVKYKVDVSKVEEEKLNILKDQPALKVSFKYEIFYEPKTAEIEFEGFVVLLVEKEKHKEILKSWKKKKLPDELRVPLFNLILTKSNLRALQLEEEIGLPTHIPMPKVKAPESPKTDYVK